MIIFLLENVFGSDGSDGLVYLGDGHVSVSIIHCKKNIVVD
jgi:hypothetical protein